MTDLEVFRIWLYRSGHEVLSWWLLATLAGVAAWPLAFRLLRRLPDRGYNLARPIGMLTTTFTLWILGSLGFLRNTPGDAILAWLIVLIIGLAAYFNYRQRDALSMGAWLRANWRVVLLGEVVFAALFFGWAVVRAYDPALGGTEKPMEMAFINAIRRSQTFPPNDPWMSGYAISYYYFGYVMIATLANLSGVVSGVAFNLTIALFFALTGAGAYGVVFSLVHSRRRARLGPGVRILTASLIIALLGPLFVVVLGNLGGIVQLFWSQHVLPGEFFNWLDIDNYGGVPATVRPHEQWHFWWWFQSSRVIRDLDLNGVRVGLQPIDEFPFFSFLLGDLHPHVLVLPFTLLALGLAFNLVRSPEGLDRYQIVFYALCLGGLIFLNLLDGPLYMAFILGAEVIRRLIAASGRLDWRDWFGTGLLGIVIGALAVLFYLPFFIGFRSQAGGLLPNPVFPTRFRQFFVMFGPFLLIIAFFLAVEWWRGRGHMNWDQAVSLTIAVLVGLVAAVIILGIVAALNPEVQATLNAAVTEAGSAFAALQAVLERRINYALTSIVLAVIVVIVAARLFGSRRVPAESPNQLSFLAPAWTVPALLLGAVVALTLALVLAANGVGVLALALALLASLCLAALAYTLIRWLLDLRHRFADVPTRPQPYAAIIAEAGFALLLIGAGAVLTLLPDYLYVADNFRARLNTVFKFYYQAWVMWGVACAYAVYSILGEWAAEIRVQSREPFARLCWGARAIFVVAALFIIASLEFAQALLTILALVAGYAVAESVIWLVAFLARAGESRPSLRPVGALCAFKVVIAIAVAAGLVYPVASVRTETANFSPDYTLTPLAEDEVEVLINRPDLDGAPTMFSLPEDEAAIRCLSEHESGGSAVVSEAVGGQYSQYARVATLSGIPTVLGWPGHESQWRGPTYGEIAGSRQADIGTLYQDPHLDTVQPIIERYNIDYIFVGFLERRDFDPAGLAKFANLEVICENQGAAVYLTNRLASQEEVP
jgi:YYY domain-containing protein